MTPMTGVEARLSLDAKSFRLISVGNKSRATLGKVAWGNEPPPICDWLSVRVTVRGSLASSFSSRVARLLSCFRVVFKH